MRISLCLDNINLLIIPERDVLINICVDVFSIRIINNDNASPFHEKIGVFHIIFNTLFFMPSIYVNDVIPTDPIEWVTVDSIGHCLHRITFNILKRYVRKLRLQVF